MPSGNDSFFDKDFNQMTEKENDEVVHRIVNMFSLKQILLQKKLVKKQGLIRTKLRKK